MKTVLIVGAGRYQRAVIRRAKALGLRVVAVDRNPDAPGLAEADVGRVVDFADADAVLGAVADLEIDGVTTVQAERAVPIVARVAEELGVPGIGVDTARRMTHKIAMRRRLAEHGVPQPGFTALGAPSEAERAGAEVGFPAVLKPGAGSGQHGLFRVESTEEVREHLADAIAVSPGEEAILEAYVEGTEMNGIVVVDRGDVRLVALCDRLRPPGRSFGVSWIHLFPPSVEGEQLAESERVAVEAVRGLGLSSGVAFPQLIATPDGRVLLVECAARIGGLMAELLEHALGVDLLEIQLRIALGEEIAEEKVSTRFRRPTAVRFLTAEPGPLHTGRVTRVGSLDPVLASPGVVDAVVYAVEGEVIRPVSVISDRRGYVIALGETRDEALERAKAAACLVEIEVDEADMTEPVRGSRCEFSLAHYRELLEAAKAGGYRFAGFDRPPEAGDLIVRHDVDLSLEAAIRMAEVEAEAGAWSTWFLMTRSVFYNLGSDEGERAIERLRELGGRVGHHAVWPRIDLDDRFDPVVAWHNPSAEYQTEPIAGATNAMSPPWYDPSHFRSDSNQNWRFRDREGHCPHAELARAELEWLHVNIHPEIWVYEGATMRETMESFLAAERELRLEHLRADRIDLT